MSASTSAPARLRVQIIFSDRLRSSQIVSDRRRLLKSLLCVPCIYNRTTSRTTGQERSQPVTTGPTSSHRQSAHVSLLVLASCAAGPYHSYVVLGNRAIVGRLVVLSVGNRSSTGSTTGLTMRLLGWKRRKYPRLPTTGPSRTTELVKGNRRF